MPQSLIPSIARPTLTLALVLWIVANAAAQMGGGMGGMGGGGAQAPPAEEKARFRDHIHSIDDLGLHREKGDTLIDDVTIVGNSRVADNTIMQKIVSRRGRYYDYETVLSDVRRLIDMGAFDDVTFDLVETPATAEQPKSVAITFRVRERPVISRVIFHGNRAMNDRELRSRGGVDRGDPLNEYAIESGRRRLIDFYREDAFNQVSIEHTIGIKHDPSIVIFRINEGPKERIRSISISGCTIVSEARLKHVITSNGPMLGVIPYINNAANMDKINNDQNVLAQYYHDLGYLKAEVGRRIEYDTTGKWLDLYFTIDEGPRFTVNSVQIVGNQYITEQSIRNRLELKPGDTFNGTFHRRDVGEVVYGYGEKGFIYAEVDPQTIMRDQTNSVDLIYKISEGDRWKVGQILVNIEGDPYLMRETTLLNMVNLREGSWINLRELENNRSRLVRSQLFEVNPQVAEPPDIKVVPVSVGGQR